MVAMTFTYGLMIPMLFPFCAFGLCSIYFVDSLFLTYMFRRPPMYDEKLFNKALYILKLCPILMFSVGYWAMSN